MYEISLIAAFVAGMVALFAPCCISYLLPAYFGNVFKEKKRILLMTGVYSLGIFAVMLPVVLGARALSTLFFKLHDTTYIVGSVLMLAIAVLAFLGIKLPVPHIQQKGKAIDIPSTFSLGIVSGITASCCAPVLVGVITLSALTPTTLQSLGVGASYVAGMVAPLYVASLLLHKGNILHKTMLNKPLTTLKIGTKRFFITTSNLIASAIFAISGLFMLVLTLRGNLGMNLAESESTKKINEVAFNISQLTRTIPLGNFIFAVALLAVIIKVLRLTKEEK